MQWLRSSPELRDAVATLIAGVILLTELVVWAAAGRAPDYVLTGFASSALLVTGALAGRRITSTGQSSSPPQLPGSPSPSSPSSPLPGASDGG